MPGVEIISSTCILGNGGWLFWGPKQGPLALVDSAWLTIGLPGSSGWIQSKVANAEFRGMKGNARCRIWGPVFGILIL